MCWDFLTYLAFLATANAVHRNEIAYKSIEAKSCGTAEKGSWSHHGGNGPANWTKMFPMFCGGISQSPIDIQTRNVISQRFRTLTFENYEKPVSSGEVINDGHTVLVRTSDGIKRGYPGILDFYNLEQLHFHWGSSSDRGAEHTIDGKHFPLELHLVHKNNLDLREVVAVLFEETPINNPNMQPIIKALKNVKYKGERAPLSALNLVSLLPKNRSYFQYWGSLTTPNCTEGIFWSLFKEPIKIGKNQLEAFRSIRSTNASGKEECYQSDNYRPIQPLNGREVTFYKTEL